MAEGLERLTPVVGAHAAGADAAKGQLFLHHVHDNVVDADAAGGGDVWLPGRCHQRGLRHW